MKKVKPDCYKCKYRGEVPGSAHICCKHPATKEMRDDPMVGLFSIMARGAMPPADNLKGIKVKGDPRGIKGGWFSWPMNFDPTWLESCNGFEGNDED